MKGELRVIHVGGDETIQDLTAPPTLDVLQAAVGGYIEEIPYFNSVKWRGEKTIQRCVAFGNEEGKLRKLKFNWRATDLWDAAFQRATRVRPDPDFLVGDIAIVSGDQEFMRALQGDDE